MTKLEFSVRPVKRGGDLADVRYECACSCKPAARYERGSAQAGMQHCCCGIVHFAGGDAEGQLNAYLEARKTDGRDPPSMRYAVTTADVKAPWGESLQVAYAVPESA